ncbi:ABC transporter permease [Defluviitalea saccharophila]|uniref:ABC transporter permease n=1 Tax=Defluviitalea saccharophila TaxID=879970 RepID=A0ABZ2Y6E2_9FIRM|nr:ABC transporter permease [Candidatus Epulonipiscium sp.]
MKKKWISYSYVLWMTIFIVVPLILVLFFSLITSTNDGFSFTLEHYRRFMDFKEPYIKVLWRSVWLAGISTIICLVLGYPVAMILASKKMSKKSFLMFLFVLPMWMNFLLRTYAWMTLLEKNGFINMILSFFNIAPLQLLYNEGAVVLGMVYNFLPFMVLPIYSVMRKIDHSVIEAAEDLGANQFTVFRKIIFPLSLPGVFSGISMVFMPAVTTFVISRLLGGGQFMLIGNLIERQFLLAGDWNFGSAVSIVMMLIILISMGFMSKYDKEHEGGGLW